MPINSTTEVAETPFWSTPADQLLARLGSTPDGLGSAEAQRRRAVSPHSAHAPAWWKLLARQFTSPIELILVGATILAGILGDVTDTIIILSIILVSGLLGFVQERGAGRAMRALLATIEPSARVLRGGSPIDIPIAQVVTGDVIGLETRGCASRRRGSAALGRPHHG